MSTLLHEKEVRHLQNDYLLHWSHSWKKEIQNIIHHQICENDWPKLHQLHHCTFNTCTLHPGQTTGTDLGSISCVHFRYLTGRLLNMLFLKRATHTVWMICCHQKLKNNYISECPAVLKYCPDIFEAYSKQNKIRANRLLG